MALLAQGPAPKHGRGDKDEPEQIPGCPDSLGGLHTTTSTPKRNCGVFSMIYLTGSWNWRFYPESKLTVLVSWFVLLQTRVKG